MPVGLTCICLWRRSSSTSTHCRPTWSPTGSSRACSRADARLETVERGYNRGDVGLRGRGRLGLEVHDHRAAGAQRRLLHLTDVAGALSLERGVKVCTPQAFMP